VRDDSATLNLIRGKPYGILSLLTEQNKVLPRPLRTRRTHRPDQVGARGSDRGFLASVEQCHASSKQQANPANPRLSTANGRASTTMPAMDEVDPNALGSEKFAKPKFLRDHFIVM
jgi:hypothetical protein